MTTSRGSGRSSTASFTTSLATGCILGCLLVSPAARAVEVNVVFDDSIECDTLLSFAGVHELGRAVFPPDELIDASAIITSQTSCTSSFDDPAIDNYLVSITNSSPFSWVNLHYVGDTSQTPGPRTSVSNFDGTVNAGVAFKIDDIGVNTPLVSEDLTANLIFEPGETWEFILQDFESINFPAVDPDFFESVAAVGLGSDVSPASSGSIIAAIIPEPATAALALLLLTLTAGFRRWRA